MNTSQILLQELDQVSIVEKPEVSLEEIKSLLKLLLPDADRLADILTNQDITNLRKLDVDLLDELSTELNVLTASIKSTIGDTGYSTVNNAYNLIKVLSLLSLEQISLLLEDNSFQSITQVIDKLTSLSSKIQGYQSPQGGTYHHGGLEWHGIYDFGSIKQHLIFIKNYLQLIVNCTSEQAPYGSKNFIHDLLTLTKNPHTSFEGVADIIADYLVYYDPCSDSIREIDPLKGERINYSEMGVVLSDTDVEYINKKLNVGAQRNPSGASFVELFIEGEKSMPKMYELKLNEDIANVLKHVFAYITRSEFITQESMEDLISSLTHNIINSSSLPNTGGSQPRGYSDKYNPNGLLYPDQNIVWRYCMIKKHLLDIASSI